MFAWGGMSSRSRWDWPLVAERRAQDILTFGTGIVAALFHAVLRRRSPFAAGPRRHLID